MLRTRIRNLILFKTTFLLLALTVIASAVLLDGCGKAKNRKIKGPSTLMPPQPPKAPSMVGADTIWNFSGNLPKISGNEEALFEYISRNLVYPPAAKENGIQGRVVVKFVVTKKGEVTNHEVIQSVHPELDAEALRIIKTITRFEPGYSDGKAITVWYEVPISFVLK